MAKMPHFWDFFGGSCAETSARKTFLPGSPKSGHIRQKGHFLPVLESTWSSFASICLARRLYRGVLAGTWNLQEKVLKLLREWVFRPSAGPLKGPWMPRVGHPPVRHIFRNFLNPENRALRRGVSGLEESCFSKWEKRPRGSVIKGEI